MTVADRFLLDVANRRKLSLDVTRAIVGVERTGSMEEAPQITVTLDDPTGSIIASSVLVRPAIRAVGTPEGFTLRPIDVLVDATWYRMTSVQRGAGTTVLQFEHRGVTYMRGRDEAMSASRAATTRALFIRRQVDQIANNRAAGHRLAFWAPDVRRRMPVAQVDESEVSTRAEPDRDVSISISRSAQGEGLTVKGVKATAAQRLDMSIVMGVAEDVKAPPKALLAAMCAAIGESTFTRVVNSLGYGGIFQGQVATGGRYFTVNDTAAMARYFFLGGKGFNEGGAIKLSREPGITPGTIATRVETSGKPGSFYDAYQGEAKKIIEALGGEVEAISASDSGVAFGTGSYVKSYRFIREKGENAWDNTGKLAEEVNRRRFVTMPSRGVDLFVYSDDLGLMRLPSQAIFSAEHPAVVGVPEYTIDYRRTARTCSLTLMADALDNPLAWGLPLTLHDAGPATGKWLVWDVRETDGSPTIDVELRAPAIGKLEPASEVASRSTSGSTVADAADISPNEGAVTGAMRGSPVPGQGPHASTHPTGGLAGYPAYDYMAPAGTPCVAPVDGTIERLSGKDPAAGGPPGGALGYSIYLNGTNGKSYFMTHLDKVSVSAGDRVRQGDQIAEVAAGPPSWSTPHVHMGIRG